MRKLKVVVKPKVIDGACHCKTTILGGNQGIGTTAQEIAVISSITSDMTNTIDTNNMPLDFLECCEGMIGDVVTNLLSLKEKIRVSVEQRRYILGEKE